MGRLFIIVFCVFSLFGKCASSYKKGVTLAVNRGSNFTDSTGNRMKIKIRNQTFTATLHDNATTAAFKAILPMTVNMMELNQNEKYVDLSKDLPTAPSKPGTIQAGDLMLYGSSTLVLFYKTFSTSYSYTKLGRIDDVEGLSEAVGSGKVAVTFELIK